MARVTVEDCLKYVDNQFDLILVASKRARQLMITGVEPLVSWENDKSTVVALREIEDGHIESIKKSIKDFEELREGKVERPYHAFVPDINDLKDARE